MKTKKSFWENMNEWFTVSRVLITFWNFIAFCYHFFVIGMTSWTSVVIQITAIITEYIVSGPYEKLLLWSNKKINKKTMNIFFPLQFFIKLLGKYITFTVIFTGTYFTTYYLRLVFFYLIDWGVDLEQLTRSMKNMFWFTLVAGPIMAILVIRRKNKKRKLDAKKHYQDRISSSVWEEFFYITTIGIIKFYS